MSRVYHIPIKLRVFHPYKFEIMEQFLLYDDSESKNDTFYVCGDQIKLFDHAL